MELITNEIEDNRKQLHLSKIKGNNGFLLCVETQLKYSIFRFSKLNQNGVNWEKDEIILKWIKMCS